jgi:hypothetical protein
LQDRAEDADDRGEADECPAERDRGVRQPDEDQQRRADELQIPALDGSWRATRVMRTLRTLDALPFVGIEAAESPTYLTEFARPVLIALALPLLDVPTMRGSSRLLTRGLATWIYQQRDEAGEPLCGGVARLGMRARIGQPVLHIS